MADVARRGDDLALAFAHRALLLHLLDKARHDLLLHNDMTFPSAFRASFDIIFVVTASAATMGADGLTAIGELEAMSLVELF